MGTIHRIGVALGRKGFRLRLWVIFAGALTFVSSVLTIIGHHLSIGQALLLAAICFITAFAASRRQMLEAQFSVNDVLPEEIDHAGRVRIECPCGASSAQQAFQLAQDCYGTDFTIARSQFEAIRAKNPHVLAGLIDKEDRLLGYFDAIPLKAPFAQVFIQGRVTEDQLRHEDAYGDSERHMCKYLFISGLAVWNPESHAGRRNASMLVWALLRYIEHYYGSAKPLVFAVAATREGDDLLRRFRMALTTDAAARIDRYRLYSVSLSAFEVNRRLACLPDWSGLCLLPWSDLVISPSRPRRPQVRHHKLGPVT